MPLNWDFYNQLPSLIRNLQDISDPTLRQQKADEIAADLSREYQKDPNFQAQKLQEIETDIILKDVPGPLMDSLKEAIFCFINGQYLSTIAVTGITAELFCVHLYNRYLMQVGLGELEVNRRIASFNRISQHEKIETLFCVVGISDSICSTLKEIKKIRNSNVHPHNQKDYHSEALDCLRSIILILNQYSAYVDRIRESQIERPAIEAPDKDEKKV